MLDLGCLPHPSDLQASAVAGVRSWREIPCWGRRAQPGLQECVRQSACEFCIGSWEPRLLPSGPWLQHAGASIFAVTRGLQLQHVNSYCLTWDPVPRPGTEPQPPSFGAWSLSHWTTGEVPRSHLLKGEAALRGEPRLQTLPVASALTAHRTGPPPISPSKRKFSVDPGDDDLDCDGDHASKMSRIFAPHLNKTANGDCRKDPRERSRSPIERAVAPTMSLHSGPLYASLPSLSMEQPLALTKNSLDAGRPAGLSPTLAPVERQQDAIKKPFLQTEAESSFSKCQRSLEAVVQWTQNGAGDSDMAPKESLAPDVGAPGLGLSST